MFPEIEPLSSSWNHSSLYMHSFKGKYCGVWVRVLRMVNQADCDPYTHTECETFDWGAVKYFFAAYWSAGFKWLIHTVFAKSFGVTRWGSPVSLSKLMLAERQFRIRIGLNCAYETWYSAPVWRVNRTETYTNADDRVSKSLEGGTLAFSKCSL